MRETTKPAAPPFDGLWSPADPTGVPARFRSQAGLTLLELTIAFFVMLMLFMMFIAVLERTSSASSTTIALSLLNQRASRAVNSIAKIVLPSGATSLEAEPTPPLGSSEVTFRTATGFQGGVVQWSNLTTVRLEIDPDDPADGEDNDGNGLIDERRVVRIINVGLPSETSEVLAEDIAVLLQGEISNGSDDNGNGLVDEPGLSFVLEGSRLIIRLTMRRKGPNGLPLTQTVETSVSMRN